MKKRIKIGFAATGALLLLTYLGLWIYSAQWFGREIDNLYAHSTDDGVEFLGPKPVLSNFPFVPEVYYTNGIKAGNATILFPELRLRGYPVPFTKLTLDFPKGISLDGIVDPAIWSLDRLQAKVIIPSHLPADFKEEELSRWQKSGGEIDVRDYLLVKGSLRSTGKGLLSLDDALQPVFFLESSMTGQDAFIREQQDKNLIDPFAAAIGMTILNSLSSVDPKTGEKSVTLKVSVRDRMLSVGPIQALPLPEIVWDKRTPPDQPL